VLADKFQTRKLTNESEFCPDQYGRAMQAFLDAGEGWSGCQISIFRPRNHLRYETNLSAYSFLGRFV